MTVSQIESEFKKKVCDEIRIVADGVDRYRVFTPFRFPDGDRLGVVLQKHRDEWTLTDEGNTFMRLSYTLDERDLEQGTRRKVIEGAVSSFGLEENDGVLVSRIENNAFGEALFGFVQAVIHIYDVTYLSRERVRSTFKEDLKDLIEDALPKEKRQFKWHDEVKDPNRVYEVDCRVEGNGTPLFLFGIQNDDKCALATIVILHYQTENLAFDSVAVFQNQQSIGAGHLARLTDVVGKQFSSLESNKRTIKKYLSKWPQHENATA